MGPGRGKVGALICMSGAHCLARDEHGDPADDTLPLCFWCLEAAERDVRALVLDYRDLEQLLPRGTSGRGDGMPRARRVDAALPINEDALDLQQEIWFVTDAWDAVVRDVCRLSGKPPRVRAGWSVQQSVTILAPRLDRLTQTSGTMWDYPGALDRCSEVPGWQGVLDLAALHRRARGALGLGRDDGELIVGVACPRCEIRSKLRRTVDHVYCGGCKSTFETAEYAGWVVQDAGRQEGEAA